MPTFYIWRKGQEEPAEVEGSRVEINGNPTEGRLSVLARDGKTVVAEFFNSEVQGWSQEE